MRLPAFITKRLYTWVWSTMGSRPSDVDIGRDETGIPYLQRWWAIRRNRFFNVYLHLYHHDDDRILHSHPWWSLSICLNGGLVEWYRPTSWHANIEHAFLRREIKVGDIVVRSADMYHRLEIAGNRTITIFITGPKLKTWYFACKHGLVHWRDHAKDGCGEDDHYPITRCNP